MNQKPVLLCGCVIFLHLFSAARHTGEPPEARWAARAARVEIVRDDYGVAHIYGHSDADAVFGLLYAQCEESFSRVEINHLEMLGRLAELRGESELYNDLQMRLIYDSVAAIRDYDTGPAWLRTLCEAAADGINFYLFRHPEVKPAVLTHFAPWYFLMRTNGSISATQNGGISQQEMMALYPAAAAPVARQQSIRSNDPTDPPGSNGFAVSGRKTLSGNAMLYINPHVSFYYRSEVEVSSDEGLAAYGAVTWGTFFVFQGFNAHCGWMHTSGMADVADLFSETVVQQTTGYFTRYDETLKPVRTRQARIRCKTDSGSRTFDFTLYQSFHGPVMGIRNGHWLSLRENNRSLGALEQSWLRTKADGFAAFKKIMDIRANASDNTVFADAGGHIAYWHGNFMPRRSPDFDYSLPVDGARSASDWHGLFPLDSLVHIYDPASGFLQNCNATPFNAAGASSPRRENYQVYMAPDGENFRGITAARLLGAARGLTADSFIHSIGYNNYLSAFDSIIPVLVKDYAAMADSGAKEKLREPLARLQTWNRVAADTSVATTIAIETGFRLLKKAEPPPDRFHAGHAVVALNSVLSATPPGEMMALLTQTLDDLTTRFGDWRLAWGAVNRYQRNAAGGFDDSAESFPVAAGPSDFGAIPAFGAVRKAGSNRRYGVYGNSFVACVEFGKTVTAKSIVTGGSSFDPASPHFLDQAEGYLHGQFKPVRFYKTDVLAHAARRYHPGQ